MKLQLFTFYLPSLFLSLQMKAEAAAATLGDAKNTGETEDSGNDGRGEFQLAQMSTAGTSDATNILDMCPKKSTKKSIAKVDHMLAGITNRCQKSLELQQNMLEMLKLLVHAIERTTVQVLDRGPGPSSITPSQVDHYQLLYRYLDMNEDIKQSAAAVRQAGMVQ